MNNEITSASVTLPGKVEKIIEAEPDEPEKAQISIEGADELYKEIRIDNSLTSHNGSEVHLKKGQKVAVTVGTEQKKPQNT